MKGIDIYLIAIPAGLLLCGLVAWFMISMPKRQRLEQRIARATQRNKGVASKKAVDVMSLRKAKEVGLPILGELLLSITSLNSLRARLERAGMQKIAPDMYVFGCAGITVIVFLVIFFLHKPLPVAIGAALLIGILVPYIVVGIKGANRVKLFLKLFPDAIDFIVRGLRSGLPVTESMNMVGAEMEQPIAGIFSEIGESIRLGVSMEKALSDTAKKLKSTEFNFFVTSITLQRETGGNLSEILSNLSDVLRKRIMMRLKIKAMASEAKASAIIVGSLPFVVILALTFVSPGYLDPLFDDPRGHKAAAGALFSLFLGLGIMIKMTRFEI